MSHSTIASHEVSISPRAIVGLLAVAFLLMPQLAHAQVSFTIPFISDIGCQVVRYMKGPLAFLIFVIVIVGTFIVGMIAKMDWSRIITIAILFGILTGMGMILANVPSAQSMAGLAGCLQ